MGGWWKGEGLYGWMVEGGGVIWLIVSAAVAIRGGRFGFKVGQIGPKWDNYEPKCT